MADTTPAPENLDENVKEETPVSPEPQESPEEATEPAPEVDEDHESFLEEAKEEFKKVVAEAEKILDEGAAGWTVQHLER